MLATMWKNKVMYSNSFTVLLCKLKRLYTFKTFVSLLSGHASYVTVTLDIGHQLGQKKFGNFSENVDLCKWSQD